jgi:hypothetical protein
MTKTQKYRIVAAQLRTRREVRDMELARDYVLAVHYAKNSWGTTTEDVAELISPREKFGSYHKAYNRVKTTLDNMQPYINNVGTAGSAGNYWLLTEEGRELLASCFEHQLLEAQS